MPNFFKSCFHVFSFVSLLKNNKKKNRYAIDTDTLLPSARSAATQRRGAAPAAGLRRARRLLGAGAVRPLGHHLHGAAGGRDRPRPKTRREPCGFGCGESSEAMAGRGVVWKRVSNTLLISKRIRLTRCVFVASPFMHSQLLPSLSAARCSQACLQLFYAHPGSEKRSQGTAGTNGIG